MTTSTDGTLTAHPPESAAPGQRCDYLFLVMDGSHPGDGGARYRLSDVAAVRIGRGRQRAARIEGTDRHRVLHIELPDRKLSAQHLSIERDLSGWQLRDEGSKNGTSVAGALTQRKALADGDTIEIGQCMLRIRTDLPYTDPANANANASSDGDTAMPRGLFSLLPDLDQDLARIARAADSPVAVLLQGETGTGKEIVARALHARSRRSGPLVAVNCGAIAPSLVESELFGHRKGAFTGADQDREGYFRRADGGTILLDEIGDLPLPAQAALLRVLNQGEVVPVGDTAPVAVDFRLVSATHRDLEAMTEAGRFRADLLGRIAGFQFALPALRHRREDLGWLAAALLPEDARARRLRISADAVRALFHYHWPRNIRQLAAVLAAACTLCEGEEIELRHLPPAVASAEPDHGASDEERAQRIRLVKLLREHNGNVSAIARATGKARMQVQRWLKRYQLDPADYRED